MDNAAIDNLLQDLEDMRSAIAISLDSCGERPSLLIIRSLHRAMVVKLQVLRGSDVPGAAEQV